MKFKLLLFLFFISINLFGQLQTTWIKTLFYNIHSFVPSPHPLSVGISGIAASENKVFALCTDNPDRQQTIYLIDSVGHLINSFNVGTYLTLQEWDSYGLVPTPDNGCAYIEHYLDFGGPIPQTVTYKLKKVSSSGGAASTIFTWSNMGLVYPIAPVRITPTYHNSFYCLIGGKFVEIPSGDTLNIPNLYHVFPDDNLIITDSLIKKITPADSVIWTTPIDSFNIICVSNNSIYARYGSYIRKYNAVDGAILWTKNINTSGIASSEKSGDGLIFLSGRNVSIMDSSGSFIGNNIINLTNSNPNPIENTIEGTIFLGGTFTSKSPDYSDTLPSPILIKLNLAGHGTIDSTSFYFSGDADQDSVESFSDDAVVIAAAFGQASGPYEVNGAFMISGYRCYSADYEGSFENGLNYKYSDTNLDGIIDENDINILDGPSTHWQTSNYPFPIHTDSTGAIITIVCNDTSFAIGDTIDFAVIMGTVANPIDSIYGISLQFGFSNYVNLNFIARDIVNGVLGDTSTNLFFRRQLSTPSPPQNGVVACRRDHQNISLSGDTLFMFEAIVGPFSTLGQHEIYGSGHILTKGGFTIPINIKSDFTNIILGTNSEINIQMVNICPNPSNEKTRLISNSEINKIRVIDLSGKIIYEKSNYSKEALLTTINFNNGLYIVEFELPKGKYYSKLIINHSN